MAVGWMLSGSRSLRRLQPEEFQSLRLRNLPGSEGSVIAHASTDPCECPRGG